MWQRRYDTPSMWLSTVEPTWLQAWVPSEWFERYATRWDDYRLPSGREERQGLAEMIGQDGRLLLQHIYAAPNPAWLRELPALAILRQVWIQQFYAEPEQARLPRSQRPAAIHSLDLHALRG